MYDKLDCTDSETTTQLVHQLVCCHCNIALPPVMWNNMNDNPIIDYCLHVWVIGFSFISHYSGLCYVPMAHPIPCWFASWLAIALSLTSNLLYFSKSPRWKIGPKNLMLQSGLLFSLLHIFNSITCKNSPRNATKAKMIFKTTFWSS